MYHHFQQYFILPIARLSVFCCDNISNSCFITNLLTLSFVARLSWLQPRMKPLDTLLKNVIIRLNYLAENTLFKENIDHLLQ